MADNPSASNPTQPIPIPPEIQAYLEGLIQEANVPVFDDKAKQELVNYLFDKLDKFLAAKIVENMSPEDTEAFIKLNEDGKSREEIDAFIKEHMKNPQEVFTRAFIDFRDFYLTGQPGAGQSASTTPAPAATPAPSTPAADMTIPSTTPTASPADATAPAEDEKLVN